MAKSDRSTFFSSRAYDQGLLLSKANYIVAYFNSFLDQYGNDLLSLHDINSLEKFFRDKIPIVLTHQQQLVVAKGFADVLLRMYPTLDYSGLYKIRQESCPCNDNSHGNEMFHLDDAAFRVLYALMDENYCLHDEMVYYLSDQSAKNKQGLLTEQGTLSFGNS